MSERRDDSYLLMSLIWCVSFGVQVGFLAWGVSRHLWVLVGVSGGFGLLAFGVGVANCYRFVSRGERQ